MTTSRQDYRLSEIEANPTFRIIDGLSIRFVESGPGSSDALLLSPWPESVFAYEPTWSRLAEATHLLAIDDARADHQRQQGHGRPTCQRRVSPRTPAAQRASPGRLHPLRVGGRRRRICGAREGLVGRRFKNL